MKKLFVFFLCIVSIKVIGQTKSSPVKLFGTIKPDIEKVVKDFYNYFDNIKGEKISENESTIEFQSKVTPAGSLESSIIQIKGLHNVYSWQAIMLRTDDYDKAAEKYKQLYRQLNNGNYYLYNNKPLKFKGNYDEPDNSHPFTSSILEPDTDEKALKKLKIEIGINYAMPEWTVKILVYEKEADADVRPTEKLNQ